jgi:hypothetical protein
VGRFYDTPHLFFNTRFANSPPWARRSRFPIRPGICRSVLGTRAATLGAEHRMGVAAVPGVRRVNQHAAAPEPTSLQQWNVSVQHQIGDWMAGVSYLGSHSSHL